LVDKSVTIGLLNEKESVGFQDKECAVEEGTSTTELRGFKRPARSLVSEELCPSQHSYPCSFDGLLALPSEPTEMATRSEPQFTIEQLEEVRYLITRFSVLAGFSVV
jgi:hypothetical protein